MGSGHPNGIVRPRFWQIERPLDEGMAVPRNVAGEHAHLTVDDLACRACILPGDAARRLALLENPVSSITSTARRHRPASRLHNAGRCRAEHEHPTVLALKSPAAAKALDRRQSPHASSRFCGAPLPTPRWIGPRRLHSFLVKSGHAFNAVGRRRYPRTGTLPRVTRTHL